MFEIFKTLRSIREAVESGLFDVGSGNLVNPISGRYYPVQRAIQMRLVQTSPEKGQQVIEKIIFLLKHFCLSYLMHWHKHMKNTEDSLVFEEVNNNSHRVVSVLVVTPALVIPTSDDLLLGLK